MFCYQKSFANPTLPVDEAQFYALVRAEQWNENIDKYRNGVEGRKNRAMEEAECNETNRIGGNGRGPY